MVSTTNPNQPREAGADTVTRQGRTPIMASAILVVILITVTGWIIYDQASSSVDGEIQDLLDAHREAWMTGDVEALRAITTEGYTYDEVVYINDPFDGFKLAFEYPGDFEDAVEDLERGGNTITRGEVSRWRIEQVGDPIVQSDGPGRLVAVNENWVTGRLHALAQSQYVLVEDDGQLKISYWYFSNITTYPDN